MTDHPTHYTEEELRERYKHQIQCIINNEFDTVFMTREERLQSSERAAELITKLIGGRT